MDNLTHAVAGAITAEVVVQWRERRGASVSVPWARWAWGMSMVAQNLPDLDILYVRILRGPLGYLLHHRGHTHTLVLAPVLGMALGGAAWLWAKVRKVSFTGGEWAGLLGLAVVGPVAHILLDFSNEYGVHPFWPLDNRWVYGDTIFIVEPLLWAITMPALVGACRSVGGRGFWSLALMVGVALCWKVGVVPAPSAALVTVVTVLASALAWWLPRALRGGWALLGSWAVVGVFALASRRADANFRTAVSRAYPGWSTQEVAHSPLPGTPFCFRAMAVQSRPDGATYAVRMGVASPWPSWVPASKCPTGSDRTTAPLHPVDVREPEGTIVSEFLAEGSEWRGRAQRCDVAAFLRWARVPFFMHRPEDPDGVLVVGDLRYDHRPALEFSELKLPPAPEGCPRWVPPWVPPRSDWIKPENP